MYISLVIAIFIAKTGPEVNFDLYVCALCLYDVDVRPRYTYRKTLSEVLEMSKLLSTTVPLLSYTKLNCRPTLRYQSFSREINHRMNE